MNVCRCCGIFLLEEQIKMNNDYKYVGVSLTPSIAQELIIEKFSGRPVKRQEIVETVIQIHEDRGGLPSESQDVRSTIKSALQRLKKQRIAENLSLGYWRIHSSPNLSERDVPESIESPQTANVEETIKRNDYPYVGVPLKPKIAQELIIENFLGKRAKREEMVELVVQIHDERGGLSSESQDVRSTIKSALQTLRKNGVAAHISNGYWQIASSSDRLEKEVPESIEPPDIPDEKEIIEPDVPSEIGSGESAVYLYYLPLYREVEQSKGESVWPCKIGSTRHDPGRRARLQTSAPEEPQLSLTIRTDAPSDMEKAIHAILTVRGRHIKHAQGREWFRTSPREVEEIHAFIVS